MISKMKLFYTYLFCSWLLLTGCNLEKSASQNDSVSSTSTVATKKSNIAFDHRYFITTAEVEGKENPTRDSKVQERIPKNTVVKLLNEASEFRDTMSVGKRNYIESYEKVQVLTTGKSTWIFGSALKPIYTGSEDITDPKNLQDFSSFISNLSPNNLETGKMVLDKLEELKSEDLTTNDAMFFMGYDYLNRLARSSKAHQSIIDNHTWTLDDYNEIMTGTMDMDYHPVGKIMHENGLALEGALGEILVKSDINVIAENYKENVSKPLQEYIDMLQLSTRSRIFDKDNIVAPLTSVVNQANLWSQFAENYPDFAHISNVKMKSDRLIQALLGGTKNTPAFDHSSRIAKAEYKEIWNYVLKHYKDTPIGKEVESHTRWLEGREWKFPEEKHVH